MVESVCDVPLTSIRRRSQQLNISETSFRRILHKDLGMTPYKVQLIQELKPIDHPKRFRVAKWIDLIYTRCDQKITVILNFFKNDLFIYQ